MSVTKNYYNNLLDSISKTIYATFERSRLNGLACIALLPVSLK